MTLYQLEDLPEGLAAPVLIAAFDGWIDAAGAASASADHLARGGELIATFDGDVLFDYRSRRPTLDVIDGVLTRLVWPALELHRRAVDGRDLLVLHGAEPDFRWKELGEDILESGAAARRGRVGQPRRDPRRRTAHEGRAGDGDGLGRRAAPRVGDAGPGRVAPRTQRLPVRDGARRQRRGIPAVGFYAQVPHYVGGPYAGATLALLQHLARHLGIHIPTGSFEEDAREQRERLDAAVEGDDDVREILHQLERANEEEIPSGDELAAEIERFLRNEGPDGGRG